MRLSESVYCVTVIFAKGDFHKQATSRRKFLQMRDRGANQQSFTVLVRPHLDRIYRLAYRFTGHREDAQDLVQDVLLKLHARIDQFAEVENAPTWLARVVYNQFVDNRRRYKVRHLRVVDAPDLSENPDRAPAVEASTEEIVEGEISVSHVESALQMLSDDHRLIIMMHDVEGYTLAEVAEITGIPVGTIKSRRFRARARLEELLNEGPGGPFFASEENRGE